MRILVPIMNEIAQRMNASPRTSVGEGDRAEDHLALPELSVFRLRLMRATYLLIVVGLGSDVWPALIGHSKQWSLMHGVTVSLLAAVTLLALVGIRYPVKLVPLLLFELTWKTIWLAAIALPLWWTDQLPPNFLESVKGCVLGLVLFPSVIPWKYVRASFVKARGERWR